MVKARRLLPRLALAVAATVVALFVAEAALRIIDGYRLDSAQLQRKAVQRDIQARGGLDDRGEALIEAFVDGRAMPEGVDWSWIADVPPPLPEHPATARQRRLQHRWGWQSSYVWNEAFVRGVEPGSQWAKDLPFLLEAEELSLFAPPDGRPVPRYRYPPLASPAPGMITNEFGWRGESLPLDKAPDTIRIACVGASTTASPGLEIDYPRLLQHWLGLWAASQGLEVRFEVINAGREGIGAADIEAVVRHEVLPMEPDLVLYYEGANDFQPCSQVELEQTAGPIPHAERDIGPRPTRSARPALARYSAMGERLARLAAAPEGLPEWPKPAQRLPPGAARDDPDLARVLTALDTIRAATADAGAELVVFSFATMVHDGLRLDPWDDASLFEHLNVHYWPCSYASLEEAFAAQNHALAGWAERSSTTWFDVAAQMPPWPGLYTDTFHLSRAGLQVRTWIMFEELVPYLQRETDEGRLPRPDRAPLTAHPAFTAPE